MQTNLKNSFIIFLSALILVFIIMIPIADTIKSNAILYGENLERAHLNMSSAKKTREVIYLNLADEIRKYNKFEGHIFEKVIAERVHENGEITDTDMEDLGYVLTAVAERYPQILESGNYTMQKRELEITNINVDYLELRYNEAKEKYLSYINAPIRQIFLSVSNYNYIDID